MTTGAGAAALVVVVAGAAAGAVNVRDAGVRVTPPATWIESAETAKGAAKGLTGAREALGEAPSVGGRAWVTPAQAPVKAVLHVQWLVASAPSDAAARGAAVRMLLDDARERPRLAALPTEAFELIAWEEQLGERVVAATIEHRHTDNGTHTLGRTLIFLGAGGRLHEVRGECLWSESGGDVKEACRAALASLAPLDEAKLAAIGAVPGQIALVVTDPGEQAPAEELPSAARGDGGLELRTPRIGESAEGAEQRIMKEPPLGGGATGGRGGGGGGENRPMSRLLLVGGGVAVLVALALTMGKKRS